MFYETKFAAEFLAAYLPEEQRIAFIDSFQQALIQRFQGHWNPLVPEQGSAYRSITMFDRIDPIFKALEVDFSFYSFPKDIVIWIDPNSVSYRVGNNYIQSIWQPIPDKPQSTIYQRSASVTLKRPPLSPPKQAQNSDKFPLESMNIS